MTLEMEAILAELKTPVRTHPWCDFAQARAYDKLALQLSGLSVRHQTKLMGRLDGMLARLRASISVGFGSAGVNQTKFS
jgi:hypothetical protein